MVRSSPSRHDVEARPFSGLGQVRHGCRPAVGQPGDAVRRYPTRLNSPVSWDCDGRVPAGFDGHPEVLMVAQSNLPPIAWFLLDWVRWWLAKVHLSEAVSGAGAAVGPDPAVGADPHIQSGFQGAHRKRAVVLVVELEPGLTR